MGIPAASFNPLGGARRAAQGSHRTSRRSKPTKPTASRGHRGAADDEEPGPRGVVRGDVRHVAYGADRHRLVREPERRTQQGDAEGRHDARPSDCVPRTAATTSSSCPVVTMNADDSSSSSIRPETRRAETTGSSGQDRADRGARRAHGEVEHGEGGAPPAQRPAVEAPGQGQDGPVRRVGGTRSGRDDAAAEVPVHGGGQGRDEQRGRQPERREQRQRVVLDGRTGPLEPAERGEPLRPVRRVVRVEAAPDDVERPGRRSPGIRRRARPRRTGR